MANSQFSKSILFVCSTNNFQNYTRRATIEAIGKIAPHSKAICICPITKRKNLYAKSKLMQVEAYYKFFPLSLLKFSFFNSVNYFINKTFYRIDISSFDYVVFTSPHQNFLLKHFSNTKSIAVLSDPYHMLSHTFNDEKEFLKSADIIFATSKMLANEYITKYFHEFIDSSIKVHYWPNCVDLEIWQNKLIKRVKPSIKQVEVRTTVIGLSGNFTVVNDLDLIETLVLHFKDQKFVFAGEVFLQKESNEYKQLQKIFSYKNVDFKGYIPYNEIPHEIMNWDIGIMADKQDELSSYVHHNKIYQYLALGKPVVYQFNHEDYTELRGPVFGAKNSKEFIFILASLIDRVNNGEDFFTSAVKLAKENSSQIRALSFLENIG